MYGVGKGQKCRCHVLNIDEEGFRGEWNAFAEQELARADSQQRYVLALLSGGIVAIWFLVQRTLVPDIAHADHLVLVAGAGGVAYMTIGERLVRRFADLTQPNRMMYFQNPKQTAALHRCWATFGIPASLRLAGLLRLAAALAFLVSLIGAWIAGWVPWFVAIPGLAVAAWWTFDGFYLLLCPPTLLRLVLARLAIGLWKMMDIDEELIRREAPEVIVAAKEDVDPDDHPQDWGIESLHYTRAVVRLIRWIPWLSAPVAIIAVGWVFVGASTSLSAGELSLAQPLLAASAAVGLGFVVADGILLTAKDTFRKHLGQLRFATLVRAPLFQPRDLPLIYVTLEALRAQRMSYDFPLAVIASAIAPGQTVLEIDDKAL